MKIRIILTILILLFTDIDANESYLIENKTNLINKFKSHFINIMGSSKDKEIKIIYNNIEKYEILLSFEYHIKTPYDKSTKNSLDSLGIPVSYMVCIIDYENDILYEFKENNNDIYIYDKIEQFSNKRYYLLKTSRMKGLVVQNVHLSYLRYFFLDKYNEWRVSTMEDVILKETKNNTNLSLNEYDSLFILSYNNYLKMKK